MRRWFSVWTEFPVSFRTIFGFSSIIIITVYYLFGHIDFFLFLLLISPSIWILLLVCIVYTDILFLIINNMCFFFYFLLCFGWLFEIFSSSTCWWCLSVVVCYRDYFKKNPLPVPIYLSKNVNKLTGGLLVSGKRCSTNFVIFIFVFFQLWLFFFFCLYFSLSLGGDEIESRYTHAVAMTPPQSCIIMRNARHPAILYLAKVVGCMLFICYLSIGHDLILSSLVLIAIQLSYVLLRWGFIDADANEMRSSPSCQFIVVPRRPRLFYFFPEKKRKRKMDTKSTKRRILFIFIFQPENEKWNQNNELVHRMI
jgi:hypothetical protein